MKIEGFNFTLVCRISPELDSVGNVWEDRPAERFQNDKGRALNAYGQGPFCKFRIPKRHPVLGSLDAIGVYALTDENGEVLYIGMCDSLQQRMNSGHGQISPRNCYQGGRPTNCRVNNEILNRAKERSSVWLFFHPTSNGESAERLEGELISAINPPWNMQKPSVSTSSVSRAVVIPRSTDVEIEIVRRSNGAINYKEHSIREAVPLIVEARNKGRTEISITSGFIHRRLEELGVIDMSQKNPNRHNSVCNALKSRELQDRAMVSPPLVEGPDPGAATQFTYKL